MVEKDPKMKVVTNQASVTVQNKFQALAEDDEAATPPPPPQLTVDLEDAIKPPSRNRQRKQKVKLCVSKDQ